MLPERTVVVATLDRTLNLDLILTPKPNSKPQHWQKPHVNGCIAIDQVSFQRWEHGARRVLSLPSVMVVALSFRNSNHVVWTWMRSGCSCVCFRWDISVILSHNDNNLIFGLNAGKLLDKDTVRPGGGEKTLLPTPNRWLSDSIKTRRNSFH